MDIRKNKPSTPFKVGILLIEGFPMISYASIVEPLRMANLLSNQTLYDIRDIPELGASSASSSGAVVKAGAFVGERVDFDLVVILAAGNQLGFQNTQVFQWLRHLSSRNVQLGGIAGGAIILANAGLMKRHRMTVDSQFSSDLMAMMPGLILEHTHYVIDRDRLTSVGGLAPLDLMTSLMSKHHGFEFARQVSSKFMELEVGSGEGFHKSNLSEEYGVVNPTIIAVIKAMTAHLANPLSLNELADLAHIGPRQLNRVFQDKLQKTTMAFYRDLRLEKACTFLTESSLSTTEIALMTGFSSSAHFSQSFRKRFGKTPSSLRRKHQP